MTLDVCEKETVWVRLCVGGCVCEREPGTTSCVTACEAGQIHERNCV